MNIWTSFPSRFFACTIMAVGFSQLLTLAPLIPNSTVRSLVTALGLMIVWAGFAIYSRSLKREILEEVKKYER